MFVKNKWSALPADVWTNVLEAIGVVAVIANGLVIGITSDFIPRLVYYYRYGPCANGTTHTHCMQGYINDTLSTAYLTHPAIQQDFLPNQMIVDGLNVTHCRYRDYRSTDDYTLTSQFWIIIAVRFAFIILFEHVVVMCKFIAAWFVPDCPMRVKNKRLQDKLGRLKEELRPGKKLLSLWFRSGLTRECMLTSAVTSFMEMLISFYIRTWHLSTLPKIHETLL